MTKEQIIESIKRRILVEQEKHDTLDWAQIAARKIYSVHLEGIANDREQQLIDDLSVIEAHYNVDFPNLTRAAKYVIAKGE